MINISPRQLQVFVETVAAGSLRAAAERLHLTQPAASMALMEMERQLDGPLFDRVRGRLRLNARGRELLPLARELLERHVEFARTAADAGGALAGELRIGTSTCSAHSHLPPRPRTRTWYGEFFSGSAIALATSGRSSG